MQINHTIQGNGLILDLSQLKIMGIVNATPDSFYTHHQYSELEGQKLQVIKMVEEGVDILDFGAISTRPGAKMIDVHDEWLRLKPILEWTRKEYPNVFISIDTFRADIVRQAYEFGANLINDISGGKYDDALWSTIADYQLPYILMHMQGDPENMQKQPLYTNVVEDVFHYLKSQLNQLKKIGIKDIIIDPGFGFGKNNVHNYELLHSLNLFKSLSHPILAGLSRKSMIYKLLDISPTDSLNGTSILNTYAVLKGANILRVHDVKEAIELKKLLLALKALD